MITPREESNVRVMMEDGHDLTCIDLFLAINRIIQQLPLPAEAIPSQETIMNVVKDACADGHKAYRQRNWKERHS